jgi:hypothetical protein
MSDGSGGAPQLDEPAVEAAAREAFWTDDLGGHIKGKHTWDSIPDEGRENYRTMIRAAIRAYLAASFGALELDLTDDEAAHAPFPCNRSFPAGEAKIVRGSLRAKLRARLDRKDDEQ